MKCRVPEHQSPETSSSSSLRDPVAVCVSSVALQSPPEVQPSQNLLYRKRYVCARLLIFACPEIQRAAKQPYPESKLGLLCQVFPRSRKYENKYARSLRALAFSDGGEQPTSMLLLARPSRMTGRAVSQHFHSLECDGNNIEKSHTFGLRT